MEFCMTVILLLIPSLAVAKHIYPSGLKQVVDGAVYELQENYIFQEKSATFTLSAGKYKHRYEDSKAIYLMGDNSACLEMRVVPPKNPEAAWSEKWDCGIFFPKDPKKGAAFFVIRKTPNAPTTSNQGPLIDAIIKAGYGSFDFPTSRHNDNILRNKLVLL